MYDLFLEYRILGNTGLKVSVIGFGTWGIGGNAYGPVTESQSLQSLRHASKLGINIFDTANIYGDGKVERILSIALKNKDCVIISKAGYLKERSDRQNFSFEQIKLQVIESCKRLRLKRLPVLLVHSPPAYVIYNTKLFKLLKESDIASHIGVSIRDIEDGFAALKNPYCEVIEVIYNLLDQRAFTSGFLSACKKNNTGVITRVPLCHGIISKNNDYQELYNLGERRKRWGWRQIRLWSNSVRSVSFLWDSQGRTPAQAGLRFCIDTSGVTCTIPGMRTIQHVYENSSAIKTKPLSASEFMKARQAFVCHYSVPK